MIHDLFCAEGNSAAEIAAALHIPPQPVLDAIEQMTDAGVFMSPCSHSRRARPPCYQGKS